MINFPNGLYSDSHLIVIKETLNNLSKSEKKQLLKELEVKPANTKEEYTQNAYKEELKKYLNGE